MVDIAKVCAAACCALLFASHGDAATPPRPLSVVGEQELPTADRPVVIELLTEPLYIPPFGDALVPATVDTRGFTSIGYHVDADAGVLMTMEWRWSEDEPFGIVNDARLGDPSPCISSVMHSNSRLTCFVPGTELQISLGNYVDTSRIVSSVRVFLMP